MGLSNETVMPIGLKLLVCYILIIIRNSLKCKEINLRQHTQEQWQLLSGDSFVFHMLTIALLV